MSYIVGTDRQQSWLLPERVDDYVSAENPVRFIDAFVAGLDLAALGFARATPAGTGRPPYDPADLLRLYVYGYLHRIRSSRRLEAEAGRNLELLWLLRQLRPDFKTIADFRKDNRACFPGVLRQFNLLCRQLDLFGAELVAIDGSQFKAVNNPHRHASAPQLQALLPQIDARIAEYLDELDGQDAATGAVADAPSRAALQVKLAQLQAQRGRYDELLAQLAATGQAAVALTDPESRRLQGVGVGYNVQLAVDAQHDLIVHAEVVQAANDRGQLSGMAQAAQMQLGVSALPVVADAGYHEAGQLERCEAAGIPTYVPAPGTTRGQSTGGQRVYPKTAFRYDTARDSYVCPSGQELRRGPTNHSRGKQRVAYLNSAACRVCAVRTHCTTMHYRQLWRLANEAVVERQAARTAAHPELVGRRKAIIEHVFGTLRHWGHDTFLTRGLASVRAEFSLSALAYNLRRVLGLVEWRTWLPVLSRWCEVAV